MSKNPGMILAESDFQEISNLKSEYLRKSEFLEHFQQTWKIPEKSSKLFYFQMEMSEIFRVLEAKSG